MAVISSTVRSRNRVPHGMFLILLFHNSSAILCIEKYPSASAVGQNLFFVIYFAVLECPSCKSTTSLQFQSFTSGYNVDFCFEKTSMHTFYYEGSLRTGWRKSAACLFRKNSGNYEFGRKSAGVIWILAMFLPLIGMVIALMLN